MVSAGMKPIDALISATSNAADLLRLTDRGVLRAGYIADMLLVRGNPIDDIKYAAQKEHHRLVFKNGVCVTRADTWREISN
jgi:imidazolonepropionase-like amidohydrolase